MKASLYNGTPRSHINHAAGPVIILLPAAAQASEAPEATNATNSSTVLGRFAGVPSIFASGGMAARITPLRSRPAAAGPARRRTKSGRPPAVSGCVDWGGFFFGGWAGGGGGGASIWCSAGRGGGRRGSHRWAWPGRPWDGGGAGRRRVAVGARGALCVCDALPPDLDGPVARAARAPPRTRARASRVRAGSSRAAEPLVLPPAGAARRGRARCDKTQSRPCGLGAEQAVL